MQGAIGKQHTTVIIPIIIAIQGVTGIITFIKPVLAAGGVISAESKCTDHAGRERISGAKDEEVTDDSLKVSTKRLNEGQRQDYNTPKTPEVAYSDNDISFVVVDVRLPRRSAWCMWGSARYDWLHGIPPTRPVNTTISSDEGSDINPELKEESDSTKKHTTTTPRDRVSISVREFPEEFCLDHPLCAEAAFAAAATELQINRE